MVVPLNPEGRLQEKALWWEAQIPRRRDILCFLGDALCRDDHPLVGHSWNQLRTHARRTLMLDSACAPGDTKPLWRCITSHSWRFGQVWNSVAAPGAEGCHGPVEKVRQQGSAGAQGRAGHVCSKGWLTRDDALVLHSAAVWNPSLVPCNSFDSPQQWDLERGAENVQKVPFYYLISYLLN